MDRKVPPPPQHQVFVNFRGDELRKNFISHLVEALQRNEINFFTDKQEKKGEDLSNLFKRIEESKIALAVFSKRYTESGWCLDELVKIKERADLGKLKVLPIFFNVTTENVKYLTEEFGSNLERHQSPHEQNKIGKWKEALACISYKLGCPFIDNNGFSSSTEREFIDSIVMNVLEMLQDISPAQTSKSVTNKHVERGEVSSKTTKSSKKALTVTKGNPASPANEYVGSNVFSVRSARRGDSTSMTKNSKPLEPSKKDLSAGELRLSHVLDFSETRPTYNGYPIRFGNPESVGRGDPSSVTKKF
ncbi:Toll/interleukin-1 receptor homology (TIR) domain-containing protein [Hirschfeldia incana]|nr:Toll/interleukin-1 receptor homology (TIR) domain-containing protein [Hirschfeldia incana]